MSSPLISPNGQPIKKQVTATHEQILAIGGSLLGTQVGMLVNGYRIPPQIIAEKLIDIVASLVAPAQPPQARMELIRHLTSRFVSQVNEQAAELGVVASVLNPNPGSGTRQ
jgi:hypothetical protein